MQREYAGTDLTEIREALREEGFTEVHEERANGFDLWRPFDNHPSHHCTHVVVWPRDEGGFWSEEY